MQILFSNVRQIYINIHLLFCSIHENRLWFFNPPYSDLQAQWRNYRMPDHRSSTCLLMQILKYFLLVSNLWKVRKNMDFSRNPIYDLEKKIKLKMCLTLTAFQDMVGMVGMVHQIRQFRWVDERQKRWSVEFLFSQALCF